MIDSVVWATSSVLALLTTQQAAERIGISVRHVQRLVACGDLTAIGTDRLDAESADQWIAQRRGSRFRAWEEPTAWAAVSLLEGRTAPWLGQAQRSRLRAALAHADPDGLSARTRNRAVVRRYAAHSRALGHLTQEDHLRRDRRLHLRTQLADPTAPAWLQLPDEARRDGQSALDLLCR